ncbi:copper-transporting ATPase PAA2, chloroplastic-like [Camelina sativa]|uniref:Copper-transporting ATPase PAA2, chloroplastic-like n=1 Tax=Camelina sativa TaxID=90675 RepID=A0A068GV66_CAMSA|nr:copper-transporting ATPase PAA2, chloroplastic-like [Camelina sativa]AID81888.1 heavy metal ATPase transporter 8 [Camelina sativa]
MASNLLRLHLLPPSSLQIPHPGNYVKRCFPKQRRLRIRRYCSRPGFLVSNSVEISTQSFESAESSIESVKSVTSDKPVLLDVSGMMCGGCVARVKSVLMSDDRVASAVVNMLTETAAVRLKSEFEVVVDVAESLAKRLTESGFEAKRRVSGMGVAENVKKWKEMVSKKEELLVKSRNRVAFAWTLVALCCGSHTSHILHSLGIHIAHGGIWDLLHNSYVKGGLAVGALLGPGRELLFDGIKAFGKRSPNMNSLVGLGSMAAFTISLISLVNPELEWDASFFEEPVMLLGFVLLGRSLEERAKLKASSDMNELLSLISTQSRLVITSSDNNNTAADSVLSSDSICVNVPVDDIRVGDSLLVLPGETFPVDGSVLAGRSVVDESMLTGESLPVFKEGGCSVSAGTINWDGPLRIKASSTGSNSTISKIVRMVEDAQGNAAPVQRLADAIAGPFVYTIMSLSAVTFAFWYYIGSHIFPDVLLNDIAGPDGDPLALSLKLAVDVLVVSCPCALGLATPTAILIGTSLGAKRGYLIRGGDVLERLASVDYVALDKTGTLTEGRPVVSGIASLRYEEQEVLKLAAAVEKTATHPIAKAIVNEAETLNLETPETRGQLTEPGFGTLAEIDGRLVAVGSLEWVSDRFLKKNDSSDMVKLESFLDTKLSSTSSTPGYSKTVVYVGREGEGIIGAIAISDCLRQDAEFTVARLQEKGIKTVLLSGDREGAVATVAKNVGIESESTNYSLSPEMKFEFIYNLQSSGHRVAMVGDGINDAPSLAQADVGIALKIEAQENAASNTASVILVRNKLSHVVDALSLAQATMSKVYQNLAWAIAYNVISIPIAAGVLLPQYDFAMTPSLSGGLMALSSIFVVSNSLLLQLHKSETNGNSL